MRTRFENRVRRRAQKIRENFSTFLLLDSVGYPVPCVIGEDPQSRLIGGGGTFDEEAKTIEVTKADLQEYGVEESVFSVGASANIGRVGNGAFTPTTSGLEILDGIEGLDNPSAPCIRFSLGDEAGLEEP